MVWDEVCRRVRAAGYDLRIVSIARLAELEEAIKGPRRRNELDPVFYDECLSFFEFSPEGRLRDARSIIIVSVPQPKTELVFHYQGLARKIILPPTYVYAVDEEVRRMIAEALAPEGYRVERARLPVKTLAVRSGLCEYGRNNITYRAATGSFHRLVSYCSDLPGDEDGWRGPAMMELCVKCRACLRNCPTGAITEDRFLIKAHKCLTFHNERQGPFPDWIDPGIHHCIVGCMRCQDVCPANKDVCDWVEPGETFDEDETRMILRARSETDLAQPTLEKLQRLFLVEYMKQLPRNLAKLLDA